MEKSRLGWKTLTKTIRTAKELIDEIKKLRDETTMPRKEREYGAGLPSDERPIVIVRDRNSLVFVKERILHLGRGINLTGDSDEEFSAFAAREMKSRENRECSARIFMRATDALRLKYFSKAVPTEVSCKAIVRREGDNFYIEELLFFKQRCSSGKTDLDTDDEKEYLREVLTPDLSEEKIERIISGRKCWIHAHKMQALWSNDDREMIERFGALGDKDYFVSIVYSMASGVFTYRCRLDIFPLFQDTAAEIEKLEVYHPSRAIFDDRPIEIVEDRGEDFDENKLKAEMEALATEKVEMDKRGFLSDDLDRVFDDEDDEYQTFVRMRGRGRAKFLGNQLLNTPSIFRDGD